MPQGVRIRNTLPQMAAGARKFGNVAKRLHDAKMAKAGQETLLAADSIVHIITESLRLSGKVDLEPLPAGVRVIVEFGGESSGENNPVDYAIYEYGRGGDHDFMTPAIEDTRDLYPAAVRTTLREAFRKAF